MKQTYARLTALAANLDPDSFRKLMDKIAGGSPRDLNNQNKVSLLLPTI